MRSIQVGLMLAMCGVLGACGGGNSSPPPPPAADTTPPDTELNAMPAALSNQDPASFTVTSTEAGSTFQYSLNGAAFVLASGATFTVGSLPQGTNTIGIRARDVTGNVDASPVTYTWTVDTVAPDTLITSGPPALSNSNSATFTFQSEPGATFFIDNLGILLPVTSPRTLTNLPDLPLVFRVQARDAAGNIDLTPADYRWEVDTASPAARIVFPTAVSYTDASQLRMRGVTTDAHTITGVSVNGVDATSPDNFATWTVTVPIAAGNNTLAVRTRDNFGNDNASATTASVANRGVVLHHLRSIAFDAARNRVLAADTEHDAIVALRGTDGFATVFSDATHGSGPALNGHFILTIDATNGRALVMLRDSNELLSVDLATGDRTLIPTAAPTADTSHFSGLSCNANCSVVYGIMEVDPLSRPPGIFSINLATGARTVITGGGVNAGSGRALGQPIDLVYDTSQGAPRLLVTDGIVNAVFAVDIATGARTIMSSALDSVGGGSTFGRPSGITLDGLRAWVVGNSNGEGRLVRVALDSGNRELFDGPQGHHPFGSSFKPVLDTVSSRVLVAQFQPASVVQVDRSNGAISRFSDSFTGTGPIVAGGSVMLDSIGVTDYLLTSALGSVVRVDLRSGERSIAALTTLPGGPRFFPKHLALDTSAGAPANRILVSDGISGSLGIYSFISNAGGFGLVSTAPLPYGSLAEFPLHSAGQHYVVNSPNGSGGSRLWFLNVAGGALTSPSTADSSHGTPGFGLLEAMALGRVNGLADQLIAMDDLGVLLHFNTNGFARAVVPSGAGPSLIRADAIAIDEARGDALLVGGSAHAIQRVNLATGNRTMVSGVNPDDATVRGLGPRIVPLRPRIALDAPDNLAHVTSNSDSVLTVDLTTGDRVISAR